MHRRLLDTQARLFFVDKTQGNWLSQKTLLLHRLFSRDEPEVEEVYRLLCNSKVRDLVGFLAAMPEGDLAQWFLQKVFAGHCHDVLLCKYRQKLQELENMDRAIGLSFSASFPP